MKLLAGSINDWHNFEGIELPDSAVPFLEHSQDKHCAGGWVAAAFKGDNPDTSKEWIIVTDDGWYFKVKAKYCVWFPDGSMRCAWSQKFARKLVQCHAAGTDAGVDPQYHT